MKAYELAKAEVGTVEWAEGSNPKVVAYYRDAGHPEVKDDAVAWCAAFVGAMLKRAGMPNTGLLTARSYLKWGDGVNLDQARPGDIVIFKRGNSTWEGHVAFFVRNAGTHLEVLGGNQRDAVNISRYPVSQLLGIRRMSAPASFNAQALGISQKATAEDRLASQKLVPQKPASAPVAPDYRKPINQDKVDKPPQPFKGFLGALLRLLWSLLPKGR